MEYLCLIKKTSQFERSFAGTHPRNAETPGTLISNMVVTNAGTVWFTGDKQGVGCYDIKNGSYTIYPCKNKIRGSHPSVNFTFLQVKSADELYICAPGICPGIFNTRTHQYTFNSKTFKELPDLNITHFKADKTGNLWCVIFGQLYYASANSNKFSTIALTDRNNPVPVKNIFKTVIWDEKRKKYYAAFDRSHVIFVLDSNMKLQQSIPIQAGEGSAQQKAEHSLYDIALDSSGRLWASSSSLLVYDSRHKKMMPAHTLYKNLFFSKTAFSKYYLPGQLLIHATIKPGLQSCLPGKPQHING